MILVLEVWLANSSIKLKVEQHVVIKKAVSYPISAVRYDWKMAKKVLVDGNDNCNTKITTYKVSSNRRMPYNPIYNVKPP